MNARLSLWAAVATRFTLAAIFVYAGCAKLAAPRAFTASIVTLQLVPFLWAEWIAAILPSAEILAGVWLATGRRTSAAALAVMGLAALFAGVAGQAMVRGLSFDCHCFGISTTPAPAWFVTVRAFALFLAAAALRWHSVRRAQVGGSGVAGRGAQ